MNFTSTFLGWRIESVKGNFITTKKPPGGGIFTPQIWWFGFREIPSKWAWNSDAGIIEKFGPEELVHGNFVLGSKCIVNVCILEASLKASLQQPKRTAFRVSHRSHRSKQHVAWVPRFS